MNSQILRAALLASLILGCFVLAMPPATERLEAWLLEGSPTNEMEKAGPAKLVTSNLRPEPVPETHVNRVPHETPLAEPVNQVVPRPRFAFEHAEGSRKSEPFPERKYPVQPTSLEEPVANTSRDPASNLVRWQRDLEQLGAKYVVVEALGDQYQCRCLLPLAPDSAYEKAFSANDLDPQRAMQAVIAQVKMWQREGAGERILRTSR